MVEIEVGGILFDMDGVLVRSTSGDERCWTRWAERHRLTASFDLRKTHGRRAADTIREHLPHITEAELSSIFRISMPLPRRSRLVSRLSPEQASF